MIQTKRLQTTISTPVTVSGFGFWSGRDVTLKFLPASENTGVVFRRVDLVGRPTISANIINRVSGPRRTTLVKDGSSVEMVEHVLSALAGLKIDNCEILTDAAEMPGMDGSSLPFVEALREVEILKQKSQRATVQVFETVRVGDQNSWILLEPSESNKFELCYQLDYPMNAVVGQQAFSSEINSERYRLSISPARTFVLQSEAEQLRRQGLGGRVTNKDILIFSDDGPVENKLRFADECARHKVLDMVGDFSLINADIVGKFTAFKSGHRLNSQVVFELLRQHGSEEFEQRRIPA